MATNALVGLIEPDGSITATMVIHDGHPSDMRRILPRWYSTPDVVRRLVSIGPIDTLGASPDDPIPPFPDASWTRIIDNADRVITTINGSPGIPRRCLLSRHGPDDDLFDGAFHGVKAVDLPNALSQARSSTADWLYLLDADANAPEGRWRLWQLVGPTIVHGILICGHIREVDVTRDSQWTIQPSMNGRTL